MPRTNRPSKRDVTQKPIEQALQRAGWVVLDTSALGRNAPDLFAAKADRVVAIECKTGREKRKPGQVEWANAWPGPYVTGNNPLTVVEMCEQLLGDR